MFKLFSICFLLIFIAIVNIGGCGGTDEDNGKTIEVSGDILFFVTGIPPGFPIFVRDCLDLIADDGTVYELVVTPPGVRLQSGMHITGLLRVVKKQVFLDFQECGEDKTAELIEVFEKTCPREGGIEDICSTRDAGCCPVEGCTPKLADCPIPSCPSNQKPCGPYCIDIDDTCCPDPDFLGESCTAGLVCCPKCPETQSGNDCADTLDDCFCTGPLPPIVEKFATVIDVSEIELETRDSEIPPLNSPCPKSNVDLRLDIELRWKNEEPPPRPGESQGDAFALANLIAFDMIGPTDDSFARYGIRDSVIDMYPFFVEVDDGRPFLAPDMLIANYVNIRFDSFVGTLLDTNEDQVIDTIEVIASGSVYEQAGETRVCDGWFTTELKGNLEQHSAPTTPILLTPVDEVIKQNNPDTGCPFDPKRGFGHEIFFDWIDSTSPNGIAGYHIFARHEGAPFPIVDNFVIDSEFTETSCNSVVVDANLTVWEWRVQAEDNLGNLSTISKTGLFHFEPCRLEDGTPCNPPPN